MTLDPGEYFVVVRGREIRPNRSSNVMYGMMGFDIPSDDTPYYDESVKNSLWKVLDQCDNMVAVELVFPPPSSNYRTIFNLKEIEIWPVTPRFAEMMQLGSQSSVSQAKLSPTTSPAQTEVRGGFGFEENR